MSRVAYISGDRGIPLPGLKGASQHVAAVCRAFRAEGWQGTVHSPRATRARVGGMPLCSPEPASISAQRPELIYERYSLWHTDGLQVARELGVPFVLEVNSPLPDEAERYRGLSDAEPARDIARGLFREADGIVCVSAEVADWVRGLGADDERVWVVPNGVDPELFRPCSVRHPMLPGPETLLIGFAGSFRPWHGLPDLLTALELLEQRHGIVAHLVCAGDGPVREPLRQAASAAGLGGRLHLPGAMPQEELRDWIGAADVAVAPYPALTDFYFSPLKIFEFMALEVPVVAADLGQASELVDGGRLGITYRAGQVSDLARALAETLDDPEAARARAREARAWVLSTATWPHRLREILGRLRS